MEIVDFILRSADEVLRAEFGQGLTDEGVHVLDPFTGTGTFLVRPLQSGLIEPHDLARKYANELHANEILLLAYYITAANIETTFEELAGLPQPFPGLVLTDSFQSWEDDDQQDLDVIPENNERLERQKRLPIQVIVGNPPYSAGQDSANDDNANEKYPTLDTAIRDTYAARSTATLKNKLYDSYIRAIKWATLRIQDRGIVAFVTNGGFLDSNVADGMRKTLAEEFSAIHGLNLRGNQRTAGEQSRREGGKVFGGGSRATVAITVLVKNPASPGPACVRYTDIGDYLTREQKLVRVAEARTIGALKFVAVTPNDHGDWLGERSDDFASYLAVADVFGLVTHGVNSGRDVWVYQSEKRKLRQNLMRSINLYNSEVSRWRADRPNLRTDADITSWVDRDQERISWSSNLLQSVRRGVNIKFDDAAVRTSSYRPFFKQHLYFSELWNSRPGGNALLFGSFGGNRAIYVAGLNSAVPFTALIVDQTPNLHLTGAGSGGAVFPRWRYEKADDSGMFNVHEGEVVDGYQKVDNITDEALAAFVAAYPDESISKDDIFNYVYGLLHSPEYREIYAADLKKMLPRIPFAADFRAFAHAGRALAVLHLGYETAEPYPLEGLAITGPGGEGDYGFFAVRDKKMVFGKPTAEQKAAGDRYDRSVIHYNDHITLRGIPVEAYRYTLGSRSAIEWIIDRYWVKTDKPSGIVNDPNDWSREVGDPRYILDLLARVVTVSLETMGIVDVLPCLDIQPSPAPATSP